MCLLAELDGLRGAGIGTARHLCRVVPLQETGTAGALLLVNDYQPVVPLQEIWQQ